MHEPIHGIKPDQIRPGQVNTGVGSSVKHDSAIKHVSGEALYTDDLPEPRDLLHIYIAQSTQAHAKILKLDLDAVKAFPGVVAVIQASDVPGRNAAERKGHDRHPPGTCPRHPIDGERAAERHHPRHRLSGHGYAPTRSSGRWRQLHDPPAECPQRSMRIFRRRGGRHRNQRRRRPDPEGLT